MPTINKIKLCSIHGKFDGIAYRSCPLCNTSNNKYYDTNIRKKDIKKIYNSKKWANVRNAALVRDIFICVECKKRGKETRATEVHHIFELEKNVGLAYDLLNLISLCHSCHMDVHRGV